MSTLELIIALLGSGGIGGLIATIANVIQAHRKSVSEQKGSNIEQSKDTLTLIDALYQKQIQWMSERMDSNDNVRKQEFDQLRTDLGGQLSNLQVENRKQNESIDGMSELLGEIVAFLNGDFKAFEEARQKNIKKGKRK